MNCSECLNSSDSLVLFDLAQHDVSVERRRDEFAFIVETSVVDSKTMVVEGLT